jgi:hypothetical protein
MIYKNFPSFILLPLALLHFITSSSTSFHYLSVGSPSGPKRAISVPFFFHVKNTLSTLFARLGLPLPLLASLLSLFPHFFPHGLFKVLPCITSSNIRNQFFTRGLLTAMMMEAVCTSETSIYFNKTIHHYIPEGCNLHTHHSYNLKSHANGNVPPKCWYPPANPHGVPIQKTTKDIFTTVRTSNLLFLFLFYSSFLQLWIYSYLCCEDFNFSATCKLKKFFLLQLRERHWRNSCKTWNAGVWRSWQWLQSVAVKGLMHHGKVINTVSNIAISYRQFVYNAILQSNNINSGTLTFLHYANSKQCTYHIYAHTDCHNT